VLSLNIYQREKHFEKCYTETSDGGSMSHTFSCVFESSEINNIMGKFQNIHIKQLKMAPTKNNLKKEGLYGARSMFLCLKPTRYVNATVGTRDQE
jgi:hypothetical protein